MKYALTLLIALACITSKAQFITNNGVSIHNSVLVTTNGDWTNATGTNLFNNGTIRTSSSFVNNGHLDETSAGKFVLNFATDLNFQPGGSEMRVLIKEGPGAALLTGTIHVRDSLLLRRGLLQMMSTTDTVFLQAGGALLADTGSHIAGGLVARAGKEDLVFPLGADGLYLPLKIYDVDAARVTVALLDAPTTHTAGPGVDSVIAFPYVWRVTGSAASDTASYVEIDYPNTLTSTPDLIVAREISGNKYASMGARSIEASLLRIKVKSYSRRLNGLFTVASGSSSHPETDSLALVALYHSTGGPEWADNTNWLTGAINTWFGIAVNEQGITAVNLANNLLEGPVPEPLADIATLQQVNLSGNAISALPDFSHNDAITSLNVSDNNLDFGALEPNAAVAGLSYLLQGEIGTASDTAIAVGSGYLFSANAGGTNSLYTWMRNGESVADSAGSTFYLPAISRQNMGEYTVEAINAKLPGLTLKSKTQKVLAYANISGTLFADSAVIAEKGEMTLYKIQPGGFDPVATVLAESDGAWEFTKVILGDYQLRGFADTLVYPNALPTYYKNTILWETADTLSVENYIDNLEIVSQHASGVLSGAGSISGSLHEVSAGGRVRENIPIAGVGVTIHEIAVEGDEEILTLAGYSFTNEGGEFTISNLPVGVYRLNFQYPGFPMDESSFTTFSIGTGTDATVAVEASLIDGKISVAELAITGLEEAAHYSLEVYPNPARYFLQFNFGTESDGRVITVSDRAGRKMFSQSAIEKVVAVDMRGMQKGIYFIQIHESGIRKKTLKINME